MSVGVVVFSILALCLGLAILDNCRRIRSDLQWIRSRFLSRHGHAVDLAHEFEQFGQLSPLYFLPLADIASEIRRARDAVSKEFDLNLNYWERLELKELEAFAATNPAQGEPFIPSDQLGNALRIWSVARHKLNVISEWERMFKSIFLDVLSGKLTVEQAEGRFQAMEQFTLLDIDHRPDSEAQKAVERIVNSWVSCWDAGSWKDRLHHLRKMRNAKEVGV